MTEHQEAKLDMVLERVNECHTTLNSRGGVIDRVEKLEKHAEDVRTFKHKAMGVILAGSAVVSVLWQQIWSWVTGGKH